MAVLTKTGPGGTELLVRPKPFEGKIPFVAAAPDSRACELRRAVERARRQGSREQLNLALHERRQFWISTCQQGADMRTASRQARELQRQHGWLFCVPSAPQVQHILDALDSAMPGWDNDHPALFFSTLELNFPELLRVTRAQGRN